MTRNRESSASYGELQLVATRKNLPDVMKVPPISPHGNGVEVIGKFGGDGMRKKKWSPGCFDRPRLIGPSPGLTGRRECSVVVFSWACASLQPRLSYDGLSALKLRGPEARNFSGLKACNVVAWAEASPTSGGPGNSCHKISRTL